MTNHLENQKRYMNEKEVALLTGFSISKLRNDRWLGRGFPFIKILRAVRYDYDTIIKYMNQHTIEPSDSGE